MDERTSGLILRTRPLTETSLIVHWLTRDFGRLSTVAKGALRPKSPFRGKLDLFYVADLSFLPSKRSELHTLKEVYVREFHTPLRRQIGYLQQAAYFAQLLERTTEINTPLPGLLSFFLEALGILSVAPPQPLTILAFEVQLLAMLGLKPDFAEGNLSAGVREILERLTVSGWEFARCLRLSQGQLDEIDPFLHRFLAFEFGKVPAGRSAALHAD
jgi:DNA repair protein RecO (recombination protein O)